jgi:hypothetical protein
MKHHIVEKNDIKTKKALPDSGKGLKMVAVQRFELRTLRI